ncbi:MAG: rod shape-determining protein MreC [Gemmatimonadetes bacterium]|nr:rod shape-determining protein MreC [Gemmatimonadota bacterium]
MPPPYAPEPEAGGTRRQGALAAVFVLLSLMALYLPESGQQQIAWALRATALRPFLAVQDRLVDSRLRAQEVTAVQSQMDSLTALVATQGALADENRTLRNLLDLNRRLGPGFRAASLLRSGTPGSESMFILDVGSVDGVREGAPVVERHGLVGVVRDVRPRSAVGIDWTHPDFRASAVLADGTAYGVAENRRGASREDDMLVLNGTAFYESVPVGMPVVTSGLGGVFPRGIPIGSVAGVADAEGRWRKSYWLRPMAHPASVTHVLVGVGEGIQDLSWAWPPDSIMTRDQAVLWDYHLADSLRALTDSVTVMRALLIQLLGLPADSSAADSTSVGDTTAVPGRREGPR